MRVPCHREQPPEHRARDAGFTGALLLWVVSSSAAGCLPARDGFRCAQNTQCISEDGKPGMCEATGFCSFVDTTCADSSRRYGDAVSEDLQGKCVGASTSGSCIAQMTAGGAHTCILKSDGSAWCWGANDHGQLGDGTMVSSAIPQPVQGFDGKVIAEISGGAEHTCARTDIGEIYCWGGNEDGQLGVVDASMQKVADSATPRRVTLPPGAGAATLLSAGGKHTCVLVGGIPYCWGENGTEQLGDGTSIERATPVQVTGLTDVVDIENGDEHTCAVRDDRTLYCWGANVDGQLGDPSVTSAAIPHRVESVTSVDQLATGDEHTCIRKPDASIFCWGYNSSGSVGNGTTDDVTVPTKIFTADSIRSNGFAFHTCAHVSDEGGVLSCWGANDKGQIGNGSSEAAVIVPTRVALITTADFVLGGSHTCAVTQDGAFFCWGDNESGQLGVEPTLASTDLPVRVSVCP